MLNYTKASNSNTNYNKDSTLNYIYSSLIAGLKGGDIMAGGDK